MGFLEGFAVVSVAVVALDSGREGERVNGLELEAPYDVDAETLVALSCAAYGFRRPSDPPWYGFGISATVAGAMFSMDRDLRFFE